jgi:hypothetical protein
MNDASPSQLIRPKFVALDSSHLGAVAADKAAHDRTRLLRAEAFERAFYETGSVLLLCWHHLQELFSHHNEDVAAQRVAYLQSLPMVAAVASFQKEDIIGMVGDLQSFEVAIAFDNPAADVLTIRDAAKSMFRSQAGLISSGLSCKTGRSCARRLQNSNHATGRWSRFRALIS